jgi:hypothetical protein
MLQQMITPHKSSPRYRFNTPLNSAQMVPKTAMDLAVAVEFGETVIGA